MDEMILENQNEIDLTYADNAAREDEYPVGKISVERGFYTAFELKRKFDSEPKRVILDGDFQRDDVWNRNKRSELIESVLMGLPLPVFYFNQDKYGRLIVVDGRQRLTSLFRFMDGDFKLTNLKILKSLNGMKFSDLTAIQQGRIEDFQIQAHVIVPPTDERIKFDIFDRVNRGGVQLNKQEIRNALYQGKAIHFLNTIVSSSEFAEATGNAFVNERRMKDKYLISRVVSALLYLGNKLEDDEGNPYNYKGDIDDLQGRAMDYLNTLKDEDIELLERGLKAALKKSYELFGQDGFRMESTQKKRTPINMNLFETIIIAILFCQESTSYERLKNDILHLKNTSTFLDNIDNHRDGEIKFKWRIGIAQAIGRGEYNYA